MLNSSKGVTVDDPELTILLSGNNWSSSLDIYALNWAGSPGQQWTAVMSGQLKAGSHFSVSDVLPRSMGFVSSFMADSPIKLKNCSTQVS